MRRHLIAFLHGVQDGWAQPYDLCWSWNTEHLWVKQADGLWDDSPQEWLDRGINIGQLARAGRRSETWQERMWPVSLITRKAGAR